jgi:hypothetical protein
MNCFINIRKLVSAIPIFVIAVFSSTVLLAQPANDLCINATLLVSGTSCTATAGNLKAGAVAATATAGVPGACGNAGAMDVWYKFVAQSAYPTISLTGAGASLSGAGTRLQLLSGTCAVWTSSLACISGGATAIINTAINPGGAGLTVGTTYYIRVTSNSITTAGATWGFNICVTDPPANDDCANATLLASGTTCTNTAGNISAALSTAGVPGSCGNASSPDVWYTFVAQTAFPDITLSSIGADFTTASTRLQLLSGSCGSWTSLACVNTAALSTRTSVPAGLVPGTTYYIRVTSNAATIPGPAGGFNICVTDPVPGKIEVSRSYINITKGTNGGNVDPGDTLEIRATFVITKNALGVNAAADSLSFVDTLYNTKGFKLLPNSLALRTNEGKVYGTNSFTDAFDADLGYTQISGLDTIIHINFGLGASKFAKGKLRHNSRPSVFTGTCIVMATYRVQVYAPYNSKIAFKTGILSYRDSVTGVYNAVTFARDSLIVYQSPGLCPNATSTSNGIGVESNGTFGAPGTGAPLARNRGASAYTLGYNYFPFFPGNGPQDYYYGIPNNTSANYSIINTQLKPDATGARVFNVWDIIGDHTGATNPTKGNPPCDTTKAVSATNPCGYMLVINSAYRTDTAFQYTATNLCPNTYYELSAWFRNICYKCACDSTGVGPSNAAYIPFAPGDSSGVQPNLAFDVNGTDYYTTGNLKYFATDLVAPKDTTQSATDTLQRWVKRGFTYMTKPNESSFTLTIRNNAPGGGGNDWAMDDISVTTCLPNMAYSPSLSPVICAGNTATVNDTVRSYFNNYTYYKWQRSTDNGGTWNDVAGGSGTSSPVLNGSTYQYVTTYNVPPSATTLSNNGDKYRVVVATAAPNLADANCQVTDGVSQITVNVISCGPPLESQLLSFNGKLVDKHANLSWTTSKEMEPLYFLVEKSTDGTSFSLIGKVEGNNMLNALNNNYSFVDSSAITDKTRYRIAMVNHSNSKSKYSRTIQLNYKPEAFLVSNVVNPFSDELSYDVTVDNDSKIEVALLNLSGHVVAQQTQTVHSGVNNFNMQNLKSLPASIYILQIQYKDKTVIRKVMKK